MLMPAIVVSAVIFGGVMWIIPSIIIAAVILGGIHLIKALSDKIEAARKAEEK